MCARVCSCKDDVFINNLSNLSHLPVLLYNHSDLLKLVNWLFLHFFMHFCSFSLSVSSAFAGHLSLKWDRNSDYFLWQFLNMYPLDLVSQQVMVMWCQNAWVPTRPALFRTPWGCQIRHWRKWCCEGHGAVSGSVRISPFFHLVSTGAEWGGTTASGRQLEPRWRPASVWTVSIFHENLILDSQGLTNIKLSWLRNE